jgi:MFS family permease
LQLGLGYVSPVSTLLRWFPDRRGMATGMAILGFGGGTTIAAPLIEYLMKRFRKLPVRTLVLCCIVLCSMLFTPSTEGACYDHLTVTP